MEWRFANGWNVELAEDRAVHLPPGEAATGTPREMVRAALEAPFRFEPLRRALTPDDRVCIVLDERLANLGELVAGVMEHLQSAGIQASAVTVLSPDPHSKQAWIDDLPDEYADVQAEVHHPDDRKKLAYLAASKSGEAIYLNRTVVDADFAIVLSAHRFHGPAGEDLLIPALSDSDHQKRVAASPTAIDERESLWLFGMPFFVRIVEGHGDSIASIVAGFGESLSEADRLRGQRWRCHLAKPPAMVIVETQATRFEELVQALAAADAVVAGSGRIALLLKNEIALTDAAAMLRGGNDIADAVAELRRHHPEGWRDAVHWAECAEDAAIYLAGPIDAALCEELFAEKIESAAELQRLIDADGQVLWLKDADRWQIDFAER